MPYLLRALFPAALLFALNFYLCRELFLHEFIDQLHSIEAAYIGLARYIQENWRDLGWFPLWYGGIPFQNTYPPLLHLMVAAVASLANMKPAHAYHAVTAVWFCLGPVTLYALALRMSGSILAAFVSGLVYSVFSPSAWLIPTILTDLGMYHGRRLQTLVVWGEGPHVSGLTLIPVACLLLFALWQKPSVPRLLAAGAICSATALTNWHAGFTLCIAVLCCWMALESGRLRALRLTILAGLIAYAFAAVWLPPSTLMTIQTNARTVGLREVLTPAKILLRWACFSGGLLALFWLLRRFRAGQAVRFSMMFLLITATLTLASEWWKIEILPQAGRYHLQMEMGVALMVGLLLARLVRDYPRWVGAGVVAILIAFSVEPVKQVRRLNRDINLRAIDMKATPMYQIGNWLREHQFQDRVFASGGIGFWLHAFTDTPNLDGGFSHGRINPVISDAWYAIQAKEPPGKALLWMKAFGIRAIAVALPGSLEPYPAPGTAGKFDHALQPLWQGPHDVLFAVPRPSTLAYRIPPHAVLHQKPPIAEMLEAYVEAIEQPAAALRSNWTSRHSLRIEGDLTGSDILNVQVSFHPGWSAAVEGRTARVRRDGLGQMLVDHGCEGRCVVELSYDGGLEMRICRFLPLLAIGLSLLLVRKFRDSAPATA